MGGWSEVGDADQSGPRPVSDGLDSLARRLGAPTASALGAVFSRWEEAVGPAVAAHSRPVSLRAGSLSVAVDHPGWATQLRYLATTVLARLEEVAGPGVVGRLDIHVQAPDRG
ncbi:MAG: DUF721 domain-containing protein [Actinobacteria bacterium]|nr:DUF721 domain-containing protein [Actinomycetota bacterium]